MKRPGIIDPITIHKRGCSRYVFVDGPRWVDAQANAQSLGANLATINDQSEHEWLMKTYKDHGMNMEVQTGVRHLFIGLTRHDGTGPKSTNAAGYSDGWISGEDSGWRPPYWGQHGEQKNADGELIIDPYGNLQKEGHQYGANYTALNILRGSQGDIHINWNDWN